jgi:Flp pilus assembly protein TadD
MSAAFQTGLRLSSLGRHAEAIEKFEQALAVEPNDARILFALGNTADQLGLSGVAEQFLRRVLSLEPGRTEAIVNLCNLLRSNGQFDAAIALLDPAVARQPTSAELHVTLGSTWAEKGDAHKAKAHYEAALAARPDYAPALANLADLLCNEGQRDKARRLYDMAVKADPKNPQARLNRAILHLLNGDLKEGWRDYGARIDVQGKVPSFGRKGSEQRSAPWTGDSLKNKRLLVRAEQGVGDQILFASLFTDLAARAKAEGGSVVLECEQRLVPLFARSFPGITVRPAIIQTIGGSPMADYGWLKSAGGANAATLMGSLPRYLRANWNSFPKPHNFLVPDAKEVSRWKEALGGPDNTKIGICWRSGKTGGHRAVEYAPLAAWGQFMRQNNASFVCVQYDAAPEEIAQLEEISDKTILVPKGIDQKNELDRACALMAALDMVVSAPTAVSWLSAGAGVRTLKVLYGLSWTALGRDYEPFAPACQCVMPKRFGDWSNVFETVQELMKTPA